jgi:hypothetical protein
VIDVDRLTDRRNARIQYVIVALVSSALLYLAVGDPGVFAALIVPLLLVTLYRSWNVERLSPPQAQYYGHTVVARAADRMVAQFAVDGWLSGSWTAAGAPLARVLALPPAQLAASMAALAAAGPPQPAMRAAGRVVNRTAAVLLGLSLGGVLGWGGFVLSWPVPVALVLLLAFRSVVAAHNRRQLDRIAAAMRAHPRAELAALLAPPWTDRRDAVVRELGRLLAGGGPRRRLPELRVVELLLAAGVAAGAFSGAAG